MDDNGNRTLGQEEVRTGLKDYGIILGADEVEHLMSVLDTNQDGGVDINEFLRALRGGLSPLRKTVVEEAFRRLDRNADGTATLADLTGTFSASAKDGTASFLRTFDSASCPDGRVTFEEFASYYAGISASVDNDEHFVALVRKGWGLDTPARPIATAPLEYGTISDTKYVKRYNKLPVAECFMTFQPAGEPAVNVTFELFTNVAPRTCENFRSLCTGERGKSSVSQQPLHYKGLHMHRVVSRFLLQGGDIIRDNGKGIESIYGKRFDDESFLTRHDRPGILTMANCGPNTNGSQFCIMLAAAPSLDGKHVAFGCVRSNLDAVLRMGRLGTHDGTPTKKIKIVDCGQCTVPC